MCTITKRINTLSFAHALILSILFQTYYFACFANYSKKYLDNFILYFKQTENIKLFFIVHLVPSKFIATALAHSILE